MNHCRSSMAVAVSFLISVPAARVAAAQSAVVHSAWKQGQTVSYVITCEEHRESQDSRADRPTVLSLQRTIHITLKVERIEADGSGSIQCTLDRIELKGDNGGRPIAYDSRRDRAGSGNSTADLLSNVAGQQFRVRLGVGGEFKAVAGLDGIWRGKGLLAAPVPALSIQFMFRDLGMLTLLKEALAPPIPADLRADSAAWTARVPTSVPGVTMLEWPATFGVAAGPATDQSDGLHVTARGPLAIARPMADVGSTGLTASVVKSNRQADLFLDVESRQVIRQQMNQDVVLSVKLIPPVGGDTPSMQIHQQIKTTVLRAPN